MDVSVIISTYNRATLLEEAVRSLLSQEHRGVEFEVLVVDNNSTDQTASLVRSLVAKNPERLKYFFEPKQGLSYGRNTGIANAQAPLLAFTDDDVRVAQNWICKIKAGFDANPDIDFLGGKVLPGWPASPPSWLTTGHWAPLALLDYGDSPFFVDAANQLCLIGANFAFRRQAFEKVGLFKTDFQRVKNGIGSLEDHEMLLRLWRAESRGLYLPGLVVTAAIEPDRMEKQYHRRWHAGHGRFYAALRSEEVERTRMGRLFGVPAHFYRRALKNVFGWTVSSIRNQPDLAFSHEVQLRYFGGFCGRRWHDFFSGENPAEPAAAKPAPRP